MLVMENMKVPYTIVTNQNDFSAALRREEWFYVFSSYGLYNKIKLVMEQLDTSFPGGKKPPIALMAEWGIEDYIPKCAVFIHTGTVPVNRQHS